MNKDPYRESYAQHKPRSRAMRWSGLFLGLAIIAMYFTPQMSIVRTIPDRLWLEEGQSQQISIPWLYELSVQGEGITVQQSSDERMADIGVEARTAAGAGDEGAPYEVTLNLFGLLPVKRVAVNVSQTRVLVPGGMNIGVGMNTRGVLVLNTTDIVDADGKTVSPAKDAGIQPGDVILAVDGSDINDGNDLTRRLTDCKAGRATLTVLRKGKEISLTVSPQSNGEMMCIGAWVRAGTAGVGTLSFYDPETNRYGALGHAISDSDTGSILLVRKGNIFHSSVVDIRQGQRGDPGELKGSFNGDDMQSIMGNIDRNNNFGIYGDASTPIVNPLYPNGLPMARQDEIVEGPAQILTTLSGEEVRAYDVEIVHATRQATPKTKSMVLKVTDPELLARTGGIVQGMSGSPIIQNGKIVGAVTHVYINDPTRGYGIYIEWMLDKGGIVGE